MAEVSALRKHPCTECGGDAEWDASKNALVCPFCGTILPWTDAETAFGAAIVEHDLEAALAAAPAEALAPGDEKKSVKCESCRAISMFDADRAAQTAEAQAALATAQARQRKLTEQIERKISENNALRRNLLLGKSGDPP